VLEVQCCFHLLVYRGKTARRISEVPIKEAPPVNKDQEPALTQSDHTELARLLCYVAIGLNTLAERHNRRYGLEGVYRSLPVMLVKERAHHDATYELCALRHGLSHLCLVQRLNPDYFDHEEVPMSLSLEFKTDDQHIADLVPVGQMICRLLEKKTPCACTLDTALRLEAALREVRENVAAGRY